MSTVHLPINLEELWSLLDREPDAALYAGGTDFLVKMRSGSETTASLICLERIVNWEIRRSGNAGYVSTLVRVKSQSNSGIRGAAAYVGGVNQSAA